MGDRKWKCGLRKKLADNGGLTVIEMLCATLILVLLCMMVSTGVSMAAHDYRMLTAEAETELLVNTIVSSLSDRLRSSTLSVNTTTDKYRHDLGMVAIAVGSAEAGDTEGKPAKGTVVLKEVKADGSISTEEKALLPDGAYGAVFKKDASDGKMRRYEVTEMSVKVIKADGTELELPPATWPAGGTYPGVGETVTYKIKVKVEDRMTHVTRGTPDDGIIVRSPNPVKKIG